MAPFHWGYLWTSLEGGYTVRSEAPVFLRSSLRPARRIMRVRRPRRISSSSRTWLPHPSCRCGSLRKWRAASAIRWKSRLPSVPSRTRIRSLRWLANCQPESLWTAWESGSSASPAVLVRTVSSSKQVPRTTRRLLRRLLLRSWKQSRRQPPPSWTRSHRRPPARMKAPWLKGRQLPPGMRAPSPEGTRIAPGQTHPLPRRPYDCAEESLPRETESRGSAFSAAWSEPTPGAK